MQGMPRSVSSRRRPNTCERMPVLAASVHSCPVPWASGLHLPDSSGSHSPARLAPMVVVRRALMYVIGNFGKRGRDGETVSVEKWRQLEWLRMCRRLAERRPVMAARTEALGWLKVQTDLGLAPRTIQANVRGLADYLVIRSRDGADPLLTVASASVRNRPTKI